MNVIKVFDPLTHIILNIIATFIIIMLFPVLGLWIIYILFINPKCLEYLNPDSVLREGDEHN